MDNSITTEKKEEKVKQNAIKAIIDNYVQNEKALVNQLFFRASHGSTIGSFREEVWKGMFEQIIPRKFVIEQSVFIIDSEGNISNEVDLAIFDETYTPYIFRYGKLKFIPIEAVAVVIECKSLSLKKDNLEKWLDGIKPLKTSKESYVRILDRINIGLDTNPARLQTQTSTRPMRILCCLNDEYKDWCRNDFDIVVRANEENECLNIEIDNNKDNLYSWYLSLNHAHGTQENRAYSLENIGKGDNNGIENINKVQKVKLKDYEVYHKDKLVSLLTFNLQLNQILMMINNPILFPHKAYAEMFNRCKEDGKNG